LTLKPFLPDSVPQGAVANVEDLRGKVLGRNIPQNSPVTTRDLNLNTGVLEGAPKGMRAVTIRVTLENAQAGFTLPGAHVDLICTLPDPRDARRTLTKTFMQRVLVLAVNAQNQVTEGGKTIPNPGTVTFAVKPSEAERIVWAKERGSIALTLRRPDDKEIVPTRGAFDAFGGIVDIEPKPVETVRILVARKQIPPNTRIDNVAEYFEAVSYPADLVPGAILEKDSAQLQQETVCHLVPEKSPLTSAHLQRVMDPKHAVTWLGVGPSTKPLRYYKFIDGRSAMPPDAEPANAGPEPERAPAPATPKRDE
jgi:Flp pilus assembly protein CpaB